MAFHGKSRSENALDLDALFASEPEIEVRPSAPAKPSPGISAVYKPSAGRTAQEFAEEPVDFADEPSPAAERFEAVVDRIHRAPTVQTPAPAARLTQPPKPAPAARVAPIAPQPKPKPQAPVRAQVAPVTPAARTRGSAAKAGAVAALVAVSVLLYVVLSGGPTAGSPKPSATTARTS